MSGNLTNVIAFPIIARPPVSAPSWSHLAGRCSATVVILPVIRIERFYDPPVRRRRRKSLLSKAFV